MSRPGIALALFLLAGLFSLPQPPAHATESAQPARRAPRQLRQDELSRRPARGLGRRTLSQRAIAGLHDARRQRPLRISRCAAAIWIEPLRDRPVRAAGAGPARNQAVAGRDRFDSAAAELVLGRDRGRGHRPDRVPAPRRRVPARVARHVASRRHCWMPASTRSTSPIAPRRTPMHWPTCSAIPSACMRATWPTCPRWANST